MPSEPAEAGVADPASAERERLRDAGWPSTLIDATTAQGLYVARIAHLGEVRFAKAADGRNGWVMLGRPNVSGEEWLADVGLVLEVRLEDIRSVTQLEE